MACRTLIAVVWILNEATATAGRSMVGMIRLAMLDTHCRVGLLFRRFGDRPIDLSILVLVYAPERLCLIRMREVSGVVIRREGCNRTSSSPSVLK
ncbi:hypothetical protein Pcac1_g4162 [Phytophthora cactorum]|nr:hypothetical protein Pcac1_g4162 [Phytophthora cactorum]